MYCGMVVAARKALRATLVCTTMYTAVLNTGSRPTDEPKRTLKVLLGCHANSDTRAGVRCLEEKPRFAFLGVQIPKAIAFPIYRPL